MATPVKVHGPPLSTAVSRVLACLIEKDVPFQLIPVNMAKGEHKSPDFLKIQPFGQVPAFQDEAISLFESRAICRLKGRALTPELSSGVPTSVCARMKLKQDESLISQMRRSWKKCWSVREEAGESRFLAGDEFSLADLSHLPNAHYLVTATDRGEMFTSKKNVGRWWGEISSRDSWKKVVDMQKQST
ncbi:putative Rhodanese/Cell cycle control phosphatase superfamily protein [Hibiscus syriacus]|uniref:glutathione transferase n=1 Tax=Hibiscus syriacus TaxID=106335 RepID=A0A6A3C4R1_HIBSY|nr:putative Rhodanese/Cell cycle control phosphatase superfamily protein [Hibiscus syriacus]